MDSREGDRGNRRLLAISWGMPPVLLPRAIQVPRTLKALAGLGWDITVVHADGCLISPRTPRDAFLTQHFGDQCRRFPVRLPWPLDRGITHRLLGKFRLGEAVWRRLGRRKAMELLEREPFDAMITFAQPWGDHLIGLDVCRRRKLPWVAHFSDPWVDNPLLHGADRKRLPAWREQEKAVIREADAAVFTTEYTVALVMRKYPRDWRDKVFVVPHGYDPTLLRFLGAPERSRRLRMVLTGNFYEGRTPMPLLLALEELNRSLPLRDQLEVLIAGAHNERYEAVAAEKGLGEIVWFRRSVPFLESLALSHSADVLLVIDAPHAEASAFLPSKLVDYLMFEKPILGITPLRGASAQLLGELGCPVAAPEDIAGISHAVSGLLEQWRTGVLAVGSGFRAVARRFEISLVTRKLDEILRGAISKTELPDGRPGRPLQAEGLPYR